MADKATPDTEPTDRTPEENASLETLESQENELQPAKVDPQADTAVEQDPNPGGDLPPPKKDKPFTRLIKQLRQRFNIYLVLFSVIILIAAVIVVIAFLQSHKPSTNSIQSQSLSQSTLDQLANSDTTVGNNHSILNVQSSAVFAGQVLLRQNLEVAGNLQIGGTVALSNISVAGTSQLGQVTVNKNLSVAGDTAIQGAATIAKGLQVNGGGTFSGALSAPQVTTGSLQLSGDLVLTHHLSAGGSTPSRSSGSALGSGGSTSVSGSDTAGSITINTGTGPAAGCFVTITFTGKYNAIPHVLVTPIGSAAGGLSYYVDRSTTNFSVCDASTPPAGSSFGFDYFVID